MRFGGFCFLMDECVSYYRCCFAFLGCCVGVGLGCMRGVGWLVV